MIIDPRTGKAFVTAAANGIPGINAIDNIGKGAQFLSDRVIRPGATAARNAASRAWEAANTPTARTIGFTAAGAGALAAGGITAGRIIGDAATQTADEKAQNMFDNYVRDLENLNKRYQNQAQIEGIGDPTKAMNRQFESDVRAQEVYNSQQLALMKGMGDLDYQEQIRRQPLYALSRGREELSKSADRASQNFQAMLANANFYR